MSTAPDVKGLEKELDDLLIKLSVCNSTISELQANIESFDDQISILRDRYKKACEQLDAETANRESISSRIEEVKKQLATIVSDEDFYDSLVELARKYLTSRSLNELRVIDKALDSYKPVAGRIGMDDLEVSPEDEITPNGDEVPFVAPQSGVGDKPYVDEHNLRVILNTLTGLGVQNGEYGVLPLKDESVVGKVFKEARKNLIGVPMTLKMDGDYYDFDVMEITPINILTGKPLGSQMERLRLLYTFVFIKWLAKQGVDMSAESVIDYLIGWDCIERDGKLYALAEGRVRMVYYRVEDVDGHVMKEVGGECKISEPYVIYTDQNGSKVIAGRSANATYEDMRDSIFKQYTSSNLFRFRAPKCSSIDFREVFAGAYLLFDGGDEA